MSYKWCAVPLCRNTTIKTPDKLFVSVPKDPTKRRTWLRLARRDPNDIATSSVIFFCEDHFNVEKDMANYFQHKMGFSQRVKMAEGALPSKFHCQQHQSGQHVSEQCVQIQLYEGYESIIDPWATAQKKAKCFAAHLVNNESSFRTVSIEVVRTTDDEELDGGIFEPAVTVQEVDSESKTEKSPSYAHHVPQEFMKSENKKTVFRPESNEKTTRSTSTNTAFMADKFVQYSYKPKYRSKAVQTRIVYINNSSGNTCVGSNSPLKDNTSCYNVQLSNIEIRELETSVRISDRKLYRSWESVKDCKDPEAYETLLDEIKNKQKTLNCMLQLIENRQALLLREQKRNEAEDDVVLALPTKRHQDTRRCLKRKRRPHESKSDHKTQIAPKQVTLYITGSSTVEEESTRSSSELPSIEVSQGPTPNVMFFTPNLT